METVIVNGVEHYKAINGKLYTDEALLKLTEPLFNALQVLANMFPNMTVGDLLEVILKEVKKNES